MAARVADDPIDARRRALFEDRYGAGWYVRVRDLLQQPCVTFAEIAEQFGVTRERVRQWQVEFFPQTPYAHARRTLCREQQQRRRLLSDPLFRAFYRHAREHLGLGRVALIAGAGGFRTRAVRLHGRVVALREAPGGRSVKTRSPRFRGRADYVYFLLPDGGFLFAPARLERNARTARFLNTFAAFAEWP